MKVLNKVEENMSNIKKILTNSAIAAIVITSLSMLGCSSGTSSSLVTVPTPTASLESAPTGYILPVGGITNDLSNFYINTGSIYFNSLALPQGTGNSPIIVAGPAILESTVTSAMVQQFNESTPILLVSAAKVESITQTLESTVVYYVSSNELSSSSQVSSIESNSWESFPFFNMVSTSAPVGVYTNGGVYIGVDTESGASNNAFIAFQNSTHATDAQPVPGTTPNNCHIQSIFSTKATTIANTVSNGNNVIAFGTNGGEVLVYGITGPNAGTCQNLTSSGQAQSQYSYGNPIVAVSYTGTTSANYGYFLTSNNQVWRVIANTSNVPQSFTEIAGSGTAFSPAPSGTLTALFSDSNNNVYVGNQSGTLYTLAPTNSAGGVNTVWTSVSLGSSPVLSISATTNGQIIATTESGVYNISFNGS